MLVKLSPCIEPDKLAEYKCESVISSIVYHMKNHLKWECIGEEEGGREGRWEGGRGRERERRNGFCQCIIPEDGSGSDLRAYYLESTLGKTRMESL